MSVHVATPTPRSERTESRLLRRLFRRQEQIDEQLRAIVNDDGEEREDDLEDAFEAIRRIVREYVYLRECVLPQVDEHALPSGARVGLCVALPRINSDVGLLIELGVLTEEQTRERLEAVSA